MTTDPITDMLNIISNAQAMRKAKATLPFSAVKFRIAEILNEKGFLSEVKKKGKGPKKLIYLGLKYGADKKPVIAGFKRISKPSYRIYRKANEIRRVRSGFGLAVISTSKGILSDQDARKQKTGGEVMLEIW